MPKSVISLSSKICFQDSDTLKIEIGIHQGFWGRVQTIILLCDARKLFVVWKRIDAIYQAIAAFSVNGENK